MHHLEPNPEKDHKADRGRFDIHQNYLLSGSMEQTRLEIQYKDTLTLLKKDLEFLDLSNSKKVLDVACGTGAVVRELCDTMRDATVIGLDKNKSLLNMGMKIMKERHLNCIFIQGDAFRLPFKNHYFDACLCRLFLQHLRDPVRLITEMSRVTVKGGIIGIIDVDDSTRIMYPEPPNLVKKLRNALDEIYRQSGGDRYVGRKLYEYFKKAGLQDINIGVNTSVWIGKPGQGAARSKNFELLFMELKDKIIQNGLLSEEELQKGIQQGRQYYSGDIFSLLTSFIAKGRVR